MISSFEMWCWRKLLGSGDHMERSYHQRIYKISYWRSTTSCIKGLQKQITALWPHYVDDQETTLKKSWFKEPFKKFEKEEGQSSMHCQVYHWQDQWKNLTTRVTTSQSWPIRQRRRISNHKWGKSVIKVGHMRWRDMVRLGNETNHHISRFLKV